MIIEPREGLISECAPAVTNIKMIEQIYSVSERLKDTVDYFKFRNVIDLRNLAT